MRSQVGTLGIVIALFASAAFGQTASGSGVDRTFQLIGGESPQATQEIVNTVRAITEMPGIVADAAHSSIAVQETLDQIAMAAWLVGELDQPTKAANLTYLPPGGADDVVRIFYLAHVGTPQQTQEIVNCIRSLTGIRRITAYNSSSAVVLRSTQAQAALAEWIVQGLDIEPGQQPASVETPVTFAPSNVAQIFYLTHGETPQQTQEMVNAIRSLSEIQRLTAYHAANAISMRGTAAQAAVAAWLVSELDKPAPQGAAEDSYVMEGTADSAVRVFYLPGIRTTQGFQEIVNQIRSGASIQRITAYQAVNAVTMRGTAGQIALAEQVIQQRNQP